MNNADKQKKNKGSENNMTAYLEDTKIDTSSIEYLKTGIRLLKFVKTVYGDEVFEKIKKGELLVWSHRHIKFDDHFRDYRVHAMTEIKVKPKEDYVDSISSDDNPLADSDPQWTIS
jgi:hypothetical protein